MSQTQHEQHIIVFENYSPDCPSFAGTVIFTIVGDQCIQECVDMGADVQPLPFTLPVSVPSIAAIRLATDDDCHAIFNRLEPNSSAAEYLVRPEYMDSARIRMLEFVDGQKGFLMLFGEACFIQLAVGGVCLDFDIDDPKQPVQQFQIQPLAICILRLEIRKFLIQSTRFSNLDQGWNMWSILNRFRSGLGWNRCSGRRG